MNTQHTLMNSLFECEPELNVPIDKKHTIEKSGALYEDLELRYLILRLAQIEYKLRLYGSGPFNDKDDFIVAAYDKKNHIKVQIRSSQYYYGGGINTKGNAAHKKLNCWTFRLNKLSALEYKKSGIDFFIFTTCFDTPYSYSGLNAEKETTRFLSWVVPTDDVLAHWNNKSNKTDYTISIYDTLFESKYYQNIQLLVDACNG